MMTLVGHFWMFEELTLQLMLADAEAAMSYPHTAKGMRGQAAHAAERIKEEIEDRREEAVMTARSTG